MIIASTEEGAGLPALEAAAAGRLVISTPVGHWPERAGSEKGITVPIEESAFTEQVIAASRNTKMIPRHLRAPAEQYKSMPPAMTGLY